VTYMVDHLLTPLAAKSITFPFVEPDERYAKDQYPTAMTGQFIAELNEYRGSGQEAFILQKGERFSTPERLSDTTALGRPARHAQRRNPFLQMHLNGGRYGAVQILKPETVAAMQEMQTSTDGSPLGFGLSWLIGKDEFGDYYYHVGDGAGSEATMRFYPDLDLGVVVMANVRGYPTETRSSLVWSTPGYIRNDLSLRTSSQNRVRHPELHNRGQPCVPPNLYSTQPHTTALSYGVESTWIGCQASLKTHRSSSMNPTAWEKSPYSPCNTDQSGIVGLVRRLHGLGMTILQYRSFRMKAKPLVSKSNAKDQ